MKRRRRDTRPSDLGIGRRDALGREVDEEIALHLELRIHQLINQGYSHTEARAVAAQRFGPIEDARIQLTNAAAMRARHMRFLEWVESVRHDVAYCLRQLRRAPGFAAAVIVTLGLGIGANAAMFGTIDQLLLRPPAHVADPARLVTVAFRDMKRDPSHLQRVLSFPIYQDLSRVRDVFNRVGIYRNVNIDVGTGADARPVPGVLATASYFETLGVTPVAGRFFTDDEAGNGPALPVAVLGYGFWQREFNGDRGIIGRAIELSGTAHTVVGIAPAGFSGVELTNVDVFVPFTDGMPPDAIAELARQRQTYAFLIVARLKPGVTTQRAAERASAAIENGAVSAGESAARLRALGRRVELRTVRPRDARGDAPESRVAELLGGVSLFVLLLACANVMNLQLARSIRRRREIAVRIALGVSRGRLMRQLVLDCLLLAFAGGAAGVLVAWSGGRFIGRTLLGGLVSGLSSVDARVFVFTLVVALVAGIATGLLPALELLRSDILSSLKEGGRTGDSRRATRVRALSLLTQAALTTVLLVGTGLFVLSVRRIEAVPLGFDPAHAAVTRLNASGRRLLPFATLDATERARARASFHRLEQTARETPGVVASAIALTAPFEGGYAGLIRIPGRDSVPVTRDGGPYYNAVSSDYFKAIGTDIVAGRSFTSSDDAQAPPVVIVNETAARLWWPGEGAVGRCVMLDENDDKCAEVVGVVRNTRRLKIVEDDYVQFFAPIDQADPLTPGVVIFRTAGDPRRVIPLMQRRLQSAVAGLPSVTIRPLDALVAPRIRSWVLGATMFAVFAALAVVLAAVGLYSVLAYDVAQRRRELGVRRALGAAAGDIAVLVARRGFRTMAAGMSVGVALCLVARSYVGPLLFQTSPRDPVVYLAVLLVIGVITMAATAIPAFRAAHVDPNLALRGD